MKKILLITGSFGNGHLQVSKAIKETFKDEYKDEVEVIESDLFLQAHPNLTPILKKIYLYSFSYFRDIYGYIYYAGKNQADTSFYRYFSYEYLKKLVKEVNPDIIVSTFPTPALSLLEGEVPVVNIVTDYQFHKSWLTKGATRYYVATEESKKHFEEVGVSSDKIKIMGLPIGKQFDEKIDKKSWLEVNGLSSVENTILLAAGAFGVTSNFSEIISTILSNELNTQIVVICGKNKNLREELQENYKENTNVKILGFTNNIREWMQSSDILVTKAGGVTISEALASNIPLILFNPVPGQEMENALYFEKKEMAYIAKSNDDVIKFISKLLLNERLTLFKKNMKINYQVKAAQRICEDILKLIK